MGELAGELPQAAGALSAQDLVRTVLLETAAASLLERPSRRLPRCLKRRSNLSSGSKTVPSAVLGSSRIIW